MAANGTFTVTIKAQDQASATIAKLNKGLAGITAPVVRAKRALDNMDGGDAVFGYMTKGIGATTSALSELSPAIAAISGGSAMTALAGMAERWARNSTVMQNSAATTGLTVDKLSELQGAARITGVSAESLTGAMEGLHTNLANSLAGLNPQSLRAFRALQIPIDKLREGAKDGSKLLPVLADKIGGIADPARRADAELRIFGASGPAIDRMLRQLSSGLDEATRRAREHGITTGETAAKGDKLRQASDELTLSLEGTANALLARLAPSFVPVLNEMTEYLDKNRQMQAASAGGLVDEMVKFLQTAEKAYEETNKLFELISKGKGPDLHFTNGETPAEAARRADVAKRNPHWNTPPEAGGAPRPALAGQRPGGMASPIAYHPGGLDNGLAQRQADLTSYMVSAFGLQPFQAAAFVGGATQESGVGAAMQEKNPIVPGSRGGEGAFMWTGPRRAALEKWSAEHGLNPQSMEASYGFLHDELGSPQFRPILDRVRGTTNIEEAKREAFVYESGGDPRAIYGRRGQYADDAWQPTSAARLPRNSQGCRWRRRHPRCRRKRLPDQPWRGLTLTVAIATTYPAL